MLLAAIGSWGVQAYSDATQEIHKYAECTADGFCRPEFYVTLADPLINGTMRIDYLPAVDPHFWQIEITGLANVTVDAQENYDTRGCITFFQDCPDTTHIDWLQNENQCLLVVDLSTDVPTYFRMVNVPQPDQVLLDGVPANITRYSDGLSVDDFPVGTHQLQFTNPVCEPCGKTQGPGITLLVLVLLVLWVFLVIVGVYMIETAGSLLIVFGGFCGIALALLYLLPCVAMTIGILVLALAIMTIFFGVAAFVYGERSA